MRFTRRVVTASLLAMALSAPAFADDKPLILLSIPGMNFPFFVHMMKALKAESEKDGLSYTESDGQDQAPKQTADLEAALAKGVKGIVISPHSVDAMAPALQEAVDANVPGRHNRPARALGRGRSCSCRRRQHQGRRGAGRT